MSTTPSDCDGGLGARDAVASPPPTLRPTRSCAALQKLLQTEKGRLRRDGDVSPPCPLPLHSLQPPDVRSVFTRKAIAHSDEYYAAFVEMLLQKSKVLPPQAPAAALAAAATDTATCGGGGGGGTAQAASGTASRHSPPPPLSQQQQAQAVGGVAVGTAAAPPPASTDYVCSPGVRRRLTGTLLGGGVFAAGADQRAG